MVEQAIPQVSVVIPVYNAVDHLDECLQSILDQTLGRDRLEVVTVDDGSTDGSGEALDRWAAEHPQVTVVHQPNSGAPGGPRNRAIALARGEYLFFADPDDHLDTDALRRMVAAAERDGSDVVLGRIRGVGRSAAHIPFETGVTVGDVHTTRAVWSLTAHKLFRRSLVTEHGLRFAEGVRLAEEQAFVVPAYFLARAISVVADHDCYYLVQRDGFDHLTRQVVDPEPFYAQVRGAVETVLAHTRPGDAQDALLLRWVQEELLNRFRGEFLDWSEDLRARYARESGAVLTDLVPDSVLTALPPLDRIRVRLLREGRLADLETLARLQQAGCPDHAAVHRDGRGYRVETRTAFTLPPGAFGPDEPRQSLLLRRTGGGPEVELPLPAADGALFTAGVRVDPAALPAPGSWQFLLRLRLGAGTYDMPLRPADLGPAGRTRPVLAGGRPRVTRIRTDRKGEALLDVLSPRAAAGALRRRLL
ncbi:glycosyltransferase family 2 protein [Streptomyces sp. NRRL B-24484]|uniref:glycosyltransferase family 2 protein n=1 Tax=Streptomyces sp. NRRL B-24484 TaxID=1463833 RepID=UPI000D13B3F7|nr:glycosyltransferase [Streptomyces sp. NRRL B-24484]